MDQGKWLDYQEIFGRRYKFSRAIGLDEALMLCDDLSRTENFIMVSMMR